MADDTTSLEMLEQKISEFQKQISIKRAMLKSEIEKENEEMIQLLQEEIGTLKDKVMYSQVELRKSYLKISNKKIEHKKEIVRS